MRCSTRAECPAPIRFGPAGFHACRYFSFPFSPPVPIHTFTPTLPSSVPARVARTLSALHPASAAPPRTCSCRAIVAPTRTDDGYWVWRGHVLGCTFAATVVPSAATRIEKPVCLSFGVSVRCSSAVGLPLFLLYAFSTALSPTLGRGMGAVRSTGLVDVDLLHTTRRTCISLPLLSTILFGNNFQTCPFDQSCGYLVARCHSLHHVLSVGLSLCFVLDARRAACPCCRSRRMTSMPQSPPTFRCARRPRNNPSVQHSPLPVWSAELPSKRICTF